MATTRKKGRRPRKPPKPVPMLMRLPAQAAPVAPRVSTARHALPLGLSAAACERCFAACRLAGGPLRSVCEALCTEACRG